MRVEVFKFLKSSLDKQALDMVTKGEDTTNMHVVYKSLVKAEQELIQMYGVKKVGGMKNNAL